MPLVKGKSKKAISENIAIERHAKKPEKQAIAIAESEARRSKDSGNGQRTIGGTRPSESRRHYDQNGWAEIRDNPISKVGVFQYSGGVVDPDGSLGLDRNKFYNVYRSAEELQDPECLDSFRLLPWIDEHVMLGATEAGLKPAEEKGIHGVIGEDVYFKDGYLRCNLKIFSEKMAKKIDKDGKKELSIGYRCLYAQESGVYDNTHYDFVQKEIRGNHIALVHKGRSGSDVAVLDGFKLTLDGKELIMAKKEDEMKAKDNMGEEEETMDSLRKENMDLKEKLKKKEAEAKDVEPEDFVDKAKVSDKMAKDGDTKKKDGDECKSEDKMAEDKKKDGMDALEQTVSELQAEVKALRDNGEKALFSRISRRDTLAKKLLPVIGAFDHKEKTLEEVEQYAVKKLGITCKPGHESSVLDGYLAGRTTTTVSNVVTMDSHPKCDDVTNYIKGVK
jgi:uncharacterized protein